MGFFLRYSLTDFRTYYKNPKGTNRYSYQEVE
jgi:hypothetical protein